VQVKSLFAYNRGEIRGQKLADSNQIQRKKKKDTAIEKKVEGLRRGG